MKTPLLILSLILSALPVARPVPAAAECSGGMCTRPSVGGPAFRQLENAAAEGGVEPGAGGEAPPASSSPPPAHFSAVLRRAGSGPIAEPPPAGVYAASAGGAAKGACARCAGKKKGPSVSGFFSAMGGAVRSFFGRACRACGL